MLKGKFSLFLTILFFMPSSGTKRPKVVAAEHSGQVIQKKSFQNRHTPLNRPGSCVLQLVNRLTDRMQDIHFNLKKPPDSTRENINLIFFF